MKNNVEDGEIVAGDVVENDVEGVENDEEEVENDEDEVANDEEPDMFEDMVVSDEVVGDKADEDREVFLQNNIEEVCLDYHN